MTDYITMQEQLTAIKIAVDDFIVDPKSKKWGDILSRILGVDHKKYKELHKQHQAAMQADDAAMQVDAMEEDTEDTEVTDESSQGDDAPQPIEPQLALIVVPQPVLPVKPVAGHIVMKGNWLTINKGEEKESFFLLAMDDVQLQDKKHEIRQLILKLHPDKNGGDREVFEQVWEQFELFEETMSALTDPLERARRIREIAIIASKDLELCWRFLTAKQLRGVLLEETLHDEEDLQKLSHQELVRLCQTPVVSPEKAAENDKKKEAKTRYGHFLRRKFKRFQKRWINANATQQLTHFAIKQRKRVHALKKKVQIEELLAASLNLQTTYARRGIRQLRPGTLKVLTKLVSAPLELNLGRGGGGKGAYWRLE